MWVTYRQRRRTPEHCQHPNVREKLETICSPVHSLADANNERKCKWLPVSVKTHDPSLVGKQLKGH